MLSQISCKNSTLPIVSLVLSSPQRGSKWLERDVMTSVVLVEDIQENKGKLELVRTISCIYPEWHLRCSFSSISVFSNFSFDSSLPHCLLRTALFNLYIFVSVLIFFCYWFILLLWSDDTLCIVSSLLHIFEVCLWPCIWFILKNVPCALRQNYVLFLLSRVF